MAAEVCEGKTGAGDEIAHRARNENLAAACDFGNAFGDVHGDSADILAAKLDLTSMETASDLDAERPYLLGDRRGAAHGASGSVEGCEKAVAEALDRAPAKARDLLPRPLVVEIENLPPSAVAEFDEPSCRTDDVSEENCRQNPIQLCLAARSGQKLFDLVDDAVHDIA